MVASAHSIGKLFPILFLVSVTFAGFFSGINGEFISDDWPQIAQNPYFESAKSVPGFFTKGVWGNSSMDEGLQTLYRPLFLLWNFTIFSLWGASPLAFHLALIVLHCINAALLFLVLERLLPEVSASGRTLAVLIFALHPAQTHCVAWISGGTDVILLFFILLSFLQYLRFKDSANKRSLFFSSLLFSAALLTKETAAVFPALLLCFNRQRKKGIPATSSVTAVFFLLLFIYLGIRSVVLDSGSLELSLKGLLRFIDFFFTAVWYTVIPFNLPFYFRYPPNGMASGIMWVGGGVLLPFSVYVFFRHRDYFFPLCWFFLFLLPPLAAAFNENGVFAVRFLYLPTVAFSLALAIFFKKKSLKSGVMAGVIAITASLLITVTHYEIRMWRSEELFFSVVLNLNPTANGGYDGLAGYYQRGKRLDEAVSVLRRGLNRIKKIDQRAPLLERLALLYADIGQNHNSIKTYEELLNTSKKEDALIGMGNNYWVLKEFDKALRFYQMAFRINGHSFFAIYNYAKLSEQLGRNTEAKLYYTKLLNIPPVKESGNAAIQDARNFLGSH